VRDLEEDQRDDGEEEQFAAHRRTVSAARLLRNRPIGLNPAAEEDRPLSARKLGQSRREGDQDQDRKARREDEASAHCHRTVASRRIFPPIVHSPPLDLCKLWNSSALFPQIARRAFPFDSTIH
jgi:hypothetical protein